MPKLFKSILGLTVLVLLVALAKALLWGVLYTFELIGLNWFSGTATEWINLVVYIGLGLGVGIFFSGRSRTAYYFGYIVLFPLVAITFLSIDLAYYAQWLHTVSSEKQVAILEAIRATDSYLETKIGHTGLLGFYLLKRNGLSLFSAAFFFFVSAFLSWISYQVGYEKPDILKNSKKNSRRNRA